MQVCDWNVNLFRGALLSCLLAAGAVAWAAGARFACGFFLYSSPVMWCDVMRAFAFVMVGAAAKGVASRPCAQPCSSRARRAGI